MPEMNDDQLGFTVDLTDPEVKTLYYAVCEAIRVWPGAPARPAEEQEHLQNLKTGLFRMICQMSYEAEAE